MFKRLLKSYNNDSGPQSEEENNGNGAAPSAVSNPVDHNRSAPAPAVAASDSFEAVYQNAAVKPPTLRYGILKVAEMAGSPHLAGMSAEPKRNSILMALEAAGAEIDFLLEDAVFRQRALNDHDEALQKKLREFELFKSGEAQRIQAELEHVTAQYMERIQANLDEVAREQDSLRVWQKRKQQECQRIAEAALLCVPSNGQSAIGALPALLERGATAASWR
jgi:hypothetical protein